MVPHCGHSLSFPYRKSRRDRASTFSQRFPPGIFFRPTSQQSGRSTTRPEALNDSPSLVRRASYRLYKYLVSAILTDAVFITGKLPDGNPSKWRSPLMRLIHRVQFYSWYHWKVSSQLRYRGNSKFSSVQTVEATLLQTQSTSRVIPGVGQ